MDDFKHDFYVLSRSVPKVTLARIQELEKRFVSRECDFEISTTHFDTLNMQRGTYSGGTNAVIPSVPFWSWFGRKGEF